MTVKELIKILSTLDQDREILKYEEGYGCCQIDEVQIFEDGTYLIY